MNGAGNDFILLDNRSGTTFLTPALVARLCDRHRGVGADGVIAVVPGPEREADWAWEFYNRDGSVAAMCGNGARCFARYVERLTGAGPVIKFASGAGIITAVVSDNRVTVNLTAPTQLRLRETLRLADAQVEVHSIDTGVPHAVVLVADVENVPVPTLGSEIRRHPRFAPAGTNVNFAQVLEPGSIRVRTFERGVEGETLACGTGVTAAALVCAKLKGFGSPVRVKVQSGETLEVGFREEAARLTDIALTGPAEFVFEGNLEL